MHIYIRLRLGYMCSFLVFCAASLGHHKKHSYLCYSVCWHCWVDGVTPLLNQVYRLVIVLVGTFNDMPSLITKQTGTGMVTNSDKSFWRKIALLWLFSHVHKNTHIALSPATVDTIFQSLIARKNNIHVSLNKYIINRRGVAGAVL